ncbi:ABC transporter substrate-binding protein [Microvirga antarctica]|uniref:ABC transporter substrate-binding protein n=1 Tax=Microvirga antarctica TaxID=2819233 RepID=UPI001B30C690|nr:ABC transporter substrate-binding protein [Microvirga antarctica]
MIVNSNDRLRVRRYVLALCLAPIFGASSAGAQGNVSCADAATQGAGGPDITIGVNGGFTGPSASFSQGMKRGIEICTKEYNDAGGYKGRKVEMIYLDDQAKPEVAINNISRFIQRDKVVGILGPVNSGNALAFLPKTEEAETPVIVPIASSVGIVYVDADGKPVANSTAPGAKPRKYTFRTSMQDDFQIETVLAYAKQAGWDAIGIMHDTSGYGSQAKATAQRIIAGQGLKILATETYNVGDTDMTSQLQKMKSAGVKQIINFGLAAELAGLLRSAQKIDYKVQWAGPWGYADPAVGRLAGQELMEGVLAVASFTIDSSPAAADFHQKMLKSFNENPFPMTAALGYDAAKLMLTALAKSGPDQVKLRDAIETLEGFSGVSSIPSRPFSPTRHHSLDSNDMFVATWRNGDLVKAK